MAGIGSLALQICQVNVRFLTATLIAIDITRTAEVET